MSRRRLWTGSGSGRSNRRQPMTSRQNVPRSWLRSVTLRRDLVDDFPGGVALEPFGDPAADDDRPAWVAERGTVEDAAYVGIEHFLLLSGIAGEPADVVRYGALDVVLRPEAGVLLQPGGV